MFQAFANHLVGGQQVGGRNTFSVGWVGNDDAGVQGLLEILEVLLCHRDVAGQSRSLDIHACGVDSFDIYIVAVDVVVERSLLGVVIINLVEELRVEVGPLLKGELLAEQTRCHITGDKGSLDEQGAGTAHRVNEVGLALPACHQYHAGSQHLVQGCLDRLLTIASTMQALAAGVQTERTFALSWSHVGNMDVQSHVRIGDADVRTLARFLAELVDNGIFYLIGHELRVAELVGKDHRVNGKCLVESKIL